MKKLILICLMLLISVSLFAEVQNRLQSYEPIYIIAGDKEDQVKFQVSFKYCLLYPFDSGLYIGYTQLSKWDLYDRSSPFRETNYNPNIFWEKNNLWCLDFLRIIPYEHKSNGLAGEDSRGIDRYFVESQISYGKKFNIGIKEKAGGYYAYSHKPKDEYSVKRYLGYFKTTLFAQIKDSHSFIGHERISITGEWTKRFYWYQAELSFRILTTKFSPHVYIQYYRGYAEFLINYYEKSDALRAGLTFNY